MTYEEARRRQEKAVVAEGDIEETYSSVTCSVGLA